MLRLAILCGMLIVAWPQASEAHFRVTTSNQNYCLDTDGTSLMLGRCSNSKLSQRWVRTLQHEIISAAHPGKCLDASGNTARNGTRVILYPCHGKWNQKWAIFLREIKIKGHKACLDVPRGKYAKGKALILWECHGKKNQRFWPGKLGTIVTPKKAAEAGFSAYAKCFAEEKDKRCYLNRRVLTKGSSDFASNYRYGFNTGRFTGTSNWTLDFGARYSADRCSNAHDDGYWGGDHCNNDMNYVACLNRVRPQTDMERAVVNEAKSYYSGSATARCNVQVGSSHGGILPLNDRYGGVEDTQWAPVGLD